MNDATKIPGLAADSGWTDTTKSATSTAPAPTLAPSPAPSSTPTRAAKKTGKKTDAKKTDEKKAQTSTAAGGKGKTRKRKYSEGALKIKQEMQALKNRAKEQRKIDQAAHKMEQLLKVLPTLSEWGLTAFVDTVLGPLSVAVKEVRATFENKSES